MATRPAQPASPPDSSSRAARERTTEEVWEEYRRTGDQEFRRELVERHAPLVRYVAERICATLPKSIDVHDLIQEGNIGLMDAINKFDLSKGVKFKTYCSSRIRGAILDALRSQDWVPRLVRQRAGRLDRIRRSWLSRWGREPTLSELASALEVDVGDVPREVGKGTPHVILNVSDRRVHSGELDGESPLELLAASDEENPADSVHRRDLMEVLSRNLTSKEKTILVLYYQKSLTLREIGQRLNLTESRVCQIRSNIVLRLKERLSGSKDQFQL
ncbi:MAG: FliA/WhiG family RNA polymerase sigma factor [Planctomycetota bacterium]